MSDIYELEEFLETRNGSGFVMTRKCPGDQYDSLIDRKVKQLQKAGKYFRVYVTTELGERELVNAS